MGHGFNAFREEIAQLIYGHCKDGAALDQQLHQLRAKYSQHDRVVEFLDKIYGVRKKVCKTYTREFYNLNHVATIIAESKNSSLKKKGKLNDKLSKFSMADLSGTLLGWEAACELKTLAALRALVCHDNYFKQPWSKFIHDMLSNSHQQVATKVAKVEQVSAGRCAHVIVYCILYIDSIEHSFRRSVTAHSPVCT